MWAVSIRMFIIGVFTSQHMVIFIIMHWHVSLHTANCSRCFNRSHILQEMCDLEKMRCQCKIKIKKSRPILQKRHSDVLLHHRGGDKCTGGMMAGKQLPMISSGLINNSSQNHCESDFPICLQYQMLLVFPMTGSILWEEQSHVHVNVTEHLGARLSQLNHE